jgi:hypothetical protein
MSKQAALVSLLLTAVACDDQAAPSYVGEPLMAIHGSISKVTGEPLEPTLRPALGWWTEGEDNWVTIQDLAVRGEFPANFTLSVLTPPPDRTLLHESDAEFAIANIVAVTPDHPPEVHSADEEESSSTTDSSGQTTTTESWCIEDDCYSERRLCPTEQSHDCQILSSTGDPKLKTRQEDFIKGRAVNYIVLYNKRPVPADSALARMMNGGGAIGAGFHLVALQEFTDQERAASDTCLDRTRAQLVEQYNREHQTQFADYDDFLSQLLWSDAEADITRLDERVEEQTLAAGCETGKVHMKIVEANTSSPIAFSLSPDGGDVIDWN